MSFLSNTRGYFIRDGRCEGLGRGTGDGLESAVANEEI
jgi:hypothetical protein